MSVEEVLQFISFN